MSAEQKFVPKSKKSNNSKQRKLSKRYSKELKVAYESHKRICNEWRRAGRPSENVRLCGRQVILEAIKATLVDSL